MYSQDNKKGNEKTLHEYALKLSWKKHAISHVFACVFAPDSYKAFKTVNLIQ